MMIQLQARINKLKSEEDSTKRKIQEAKRQGQFIATMREEKAKMREERERKAMEQAIEVERARRRIVEERTVLQHQLRQSKVSANVRTIQNSQEVRAQKDRIR